MERVLQDWEDFALSLGAVTSSMDAKALRDHAELILRAVAADLETAQTSAQQDAKSKGDAPRRLSHLPVSAATSHGVTRAKEGFSLQQMVSEFRALRASVPKLWAQAQPARDADTFEQLVRFNEAIDEALADSIATYSHAIDQTAVTKARHRFEALGTLSAGLGHDMANVLMPMRACLAGLADQTLTPENGPLVGALNRAVEHLSGLARGLKALSMDPDSAAGSAHCIVLREWWAGAISPFTWTLPRGVRLHAQGFAATDAALPPVSVPAHVLMQAVFNLVQNAAQAIGKRNADNPGTKPIGNIWIAARLETAASNEASPARECAVHLTVRDDGPGMDASTAARCTEPFFTTKAKDQGTGLGLYLVRTILERHKADLRIDSKPGEGSLFTLILPVAEGPAAPATSGA